MYSQRVTDAALAEASRRQGWDLKRHSQAEIDRAIAHFKELWDEDARRLRRPLNPEEQRFIQNERKVCALDFRYWAGSYSWILNYEQRPQLFTPNVAQAIVLDLWAEREEQGLPIWMQQLKARRLGVSTVSELAVNHRFQFHPYSNCVVASADPTKTLSLASMIKFSIDRQPWWLLPQGKTKIKSGLIVEFEDIHTMLTFQSGNQFTGVARGSTPNVIHLSELMEFQDAEDIVDGALMRAVIDKPNVLAIMESTGGKIEGWWNRTWEQNKKDYARGTARVVPVFLPWYVGTDLYPTPEDLIARPVPDDWVPDERTVNHAERAREYVLSNKLLFKYLAKGDRNWRMPREQMYFRHMEYRSAKEKKTLYIFHQELAGNDFEAFQSSNVPYVDEEILLAYEERTRKPIGVYTVIGPDIPPRMVAPKRYWDLDEDGNFRPENPPVTVSTTGLLQRYDLKYQLVPLKVEDIYTLDPEMKLLVWEWPKPGCRYGVGVDCGMGVGQDNSAIEVLREAMPEREPGQVAEWVSNRCTGFQMWPVVMALGALYSAEGPDGSRRQSRMAIESAANGSAVQNELRKRGWWNFHARQYNDRRQPIPEGNTANIGILMNYWFRKTMMDMLLTCLSEEAIDLPSRFFVKELKTLERPPDEEKGEAALGAHDDRVMALGMPLFSLHMGKMPAKQYARKRVEYVPGLSEETVVHPTWKPSPQASSVAFQPVHKVYRDHTGARLQRITNNTMPKGFR